VKTAQSFGDAANPKALATSATLGMNSSAARKRTGAASQTGWDEVLTCESSESEDSMLSLNGLTAGELIEAFTALDDWEARFTYLLDLAQGVPVLDEADLVDENRIFGCVSQVWVKCAIINDDPPRLEFVANSDAQLVTGLIAILMVLYNGRTLAEVIRVDARDVLKQMDLDANLSPTRRNGLFAMVQHIQNQAHRAMGEG
jgi:cysteine desulfuration protein SufE